MIVTGMPLPIRRINGLYYSASHKALCRSPSHSIIPLTAIFITRRCESNQCRSVRGREETWNTVTVAEKPNLFVRRNYNVDLPPRRAVWPT